MQVALMLGRTEDPRRRQGLHVMEVRSYKQHRKSGGSNGDGIWQDNLESKGSRMI